VIRAKPACKMLRNVFAFALLLAGLTALDAQKFINENYLKLAVGDRLKQDGTHPNGNRWGKL
jgi:hypothetical protein